MLGPEEGPAGGCPLSLVGWGHQRASPKGSQSGHMYGLTGIGVFRNIVTPSKYTFEEEIFEVPCTPS